jgi:hypothetical protein
LWTLLLLVPVLYVNQEMVLRLGAVTGVGHARLILERFGKFWGAFSVIDLFLLNGLTIVTEFIGIALALDYLGLSKELGVALSAVLTMRPGPRMARRVWRRRLQLSRGPWSPCRMVPKAPRMWPTWAWSRTAVRGAVISAIAFMARLLIPD